MTIAAFTFTRSYGNYKEQVEEKVEVLEDYLGRGEKRFRQTEARVFKPGAFHLPKVQLFAQR